jgi:lipoyl-dependent peroxiredoxin
MTTTGKTLYTGKVHTIGGRQGTSRSEDGRLDIQLSPPGSAGVGTNPEQLFAAGWSACFLGALARAAANMKLELPPDTALDAEVDLRSLDGGFFLQARLRAHLPGLARDVAQSLMEAAHQICPYSKATRGNIAVELEVV